MMTMMNMEWERSSSTGRKVDKERIRKSKGSKQQTHSASDAERRMMQMLLPTDVLLVGRPVLQRLTPGNAQYSELIKQLRSVFQAADKLEKDDVAHTFLATTWSQGGRFLQHDSLKGTISILSNEQAERLIRQDLNTKSKERTVKPARKRVSKTKVKKAPTKAQKKTMQAKKTRKQNRRRTRPMKVAPVLTQEDSPNVKLFGQASNGVLFGDV